MDSFTYTIKTCNFICTTFHSHIDIPGTNTNSTHTYVGTNIFIQKHLQKSISYAHLPQHTIEITYCFASCCGMRQAMKPPYNIPTPYRNARSSLGSHTNVKAMRPNKKSQRSFKTYKQIDTYFIDKD